MKYRLIAIALALVLSALTFSAESQRRLPGIRIDKPPVIDGALDDEAWTKAAKAEGFTDSFSGSLVEDQTRAYICYDSQAIYVAFECFDSNPESLIAREIRPGTSFRGEDFVVLRIDPFRTNINEQINRFHVNLLGTQNEEMAGGRAAKREWRGEWQSAAKRTSFGYVVEMSIPWRALSFPAGAKLRDMTINFVRMHGRLQRSSTWSDTTAANRPELNGIWEGVDTPESHIKPRPSFLAYSVGEYDDGAGVAVFDAGIDMRYPFTTQLTGVASINPDFKNVEQAVESIEFSRGERFLGDTRPFFAEGSSFFNMTSQHAIGRLFYSRRIDDFDVGAKVIGRLNDHLSLGGLVTYGEDETTSAAFLVTQTLGVDRALKLFGTHRNDPTRTNSALGASFDGRYGNWSGAGEAIYDVDRDRNGTAYSLAASYEVPKLFASLRYTFVGEDYDPALSLTEFSGYRGAYIFTRFEDRYSSGWLREINADLFVSKYTYLDGSSQEDGFSLALEAETANDHGIEVGTEDFLFDGERHRLYHGYYVIGDSNRFSQYGGGFQIGERAGIAYRSVRAEASQRLLGKLDVGFSFASVDYEELFTQLILTAGWEFDSKRALVGRLVRNGDVLNAYLAFRSSGFAGKELFLILGDPNAREFRRRLAVKLVIPF